MNKFLKGLSWLLLASLISISAWSCGSIIKIIVGVPNLNVYSQEEIYNNINSLPKQENVIDVQPITNLNSEDISYFTLISLPHGPLIYNSNNSLLCYNGEATCSAVELKELNNSTIDENYEECDATDFSSAANKYIGNFNSLLNYITFPSSIDLDSYQHKVVVFMNTDLGKDEINEDWDLIYQPLSHNPDVVFIRIWTDLNEEWGLKHNAKVRTKVTKVKGSKKEYFMQLSKLPYKKDNKK